MASYGVPITIQLPVAGQVQWDSPLNDRLQALIDVLSERVTVDGLDISAALDMQGSALVNAGNVRFVADVDPGVANSIYYSGGELYIRDGANRAIQATSGGVLNLAGQGGFGGDYVSSNQNGASFTNSTSRFVFTASGGTVYASMEHGPVIIHDGSTSNAVTVQSRQSLAGSYSLSLPPALPADGQAIVTIDATGTMNVRPSSSFSVSWVDMIDASSAVPSGSSTATYGNLGWFLNSVGASVDFPIRYKVGDTITRIDIGTRAFQGSSAHITATLWHRANGGLNEAIIARASFNGGSAGFRTLSSTTTTLTGTLPFTPPGTGSIFLRYSIDQNSDAVGLIRVSGTTRPLI